MYQWGVLTYVFGTTPKQKFSRCCRDIDGERFVIAMRSDTRPSPHRELALPSPQKRQLLKFANKLSTHQQKAIELFINEEKRYSYQYTNCIWQVDPLSGFACSI